MVVVRVTLVCFGALRDHLPVSARRNRAELELADGATVGDAIAALGAPAGLVFACLVDGEQATADIRLEEGAEVTLMPPFTGGL